MHGDAANGARDFFPVASDTLETGVSRLDSDWEQDNPKEECGVFGIFAPGEEVARITFFGLFALQHRGQESAGMAVSDGHKIHVHKDMGLVT